MVDFRRMIPVLAVIAFLLGSAVTASAQQTLSCTTNGAVNVPMRAEGLTEQTGDFLITCVGGTPTVAGQLVPTVNIQIFLNTAITSRLLGSSDTIPPAGSPQPSEALLLLDEPPPASQFGCALATCPAVGAGAQAAFANIYGAGTVGTIGNTRNVYQGLQTASNSITWLGIPIDPPGTIGTRIIRIANIRGNANALGVSGTNVAPVSVFATVTATPNNFLPVSGLATQAVGSVQRGLNFTLLPGSGTTFTVVNFQQCISRLIDATPGSVAFARLRYSELFATSFKKRFISTTAANAGTAAAGPGAGGAAPQQNNLTLGVYNTESQFVNTGLTLPSGAATTVGLADWGTRLKAVFNNVPTGVNLFVDRTATANGGLDQAILHNGSETAAFSPAAVGTGPAGSVALTPLNGTATAIWEVVDSDSNSFASFDFRVWASFTASPATNSPALAVATVNGSYAPTSTVTAANRANIPRFADTSTASNLFQVIPCQTTLLFPYVTSVGGFDTGLAISNTSQDGAVFTTPTAPQTGTCTLNWFGAAFTGVTQLPGGAVNAGTTRAALTSTELSNVTGGFSGYMIAVCRFQYAHGFAFVSDLGARNLAMGYLALIIPDRTRVPDPFPTAGSGSGEQLGY